jgi:hypothetical protein
MGSRWLTADELAVIEKLLREGGTASSIGAAVGRSRNSIVGIVHRRLKHIGFKLPAPKMVKLVKLRRKLEAKRAVIRERAMIAPDREAIPISIKVVDEIPPPPIVIVPPEPEPVLQPLLWELKGHQCRYPMWGSEVTDINEKRFCGALQTKGSYCAYHAGLTYTGVHRR